MHVLPGPWLLAVLNGTVLLVAVGVATYVWRHRGAPSGRPSRQWQERTAELAGEVRRTADATDGVADPDRVARRLLPLAGRIKSHVREAPPSVDERAYRELFELGVSCQRLAIEHRPGTARRSGVFLEDRLDALRDAAATLEEPNQEDPAASGQRLIEAAFEDGEGEVP